MTSLVAGCPEPEPEPVGPELDCSTTFFHQPQGGASSTLPSVIGDFNGWDVSKGLMHDEDGDGVFSKTVTLNPGWHAYLIQDDLGRTLNHRYNPLTSYAYNAREEVSTVHVRNCSIPLLRVLTSTPHANNGSWRAELLFLRTPGGASLDTVDATHSGAAHIHTTKQADTGKISLHIPNLNAGKHHVLVQATDANNVVSEPIELIFWMEPKDAFSWEGATIYQIFVDRFASSTQGGLDSTKGISMFHGGDLDGAREVLESGYFDQLGVNAIWLSPVIKNPNGVFTGRDGYDAEPYHGYWPSKPREVDERFGGAQALDRFVEAAHARGIRVILDAVLNHVHQEHPYFAQNKKNTPNARDAWFNNADGTCQCGFSCPWHLHMEDCWFDPFLPDLQWRNPLVVDTMVEDTVWWVERFDLDGLRLDAVPMMPRLAMRHVRAKLRARFEAAGEHLYLIGENYTQREEQASIRYYLGDHTLSGLFDFPIMWALRDTIAKSDNFMGLEQEIIKSELAWSGSGAIMGVMLGNHDVPRFISDVRQDPVWSPRTNPPKQPPVQDLSYAQLMFAWTFIMSQPGAATIYYGDEIGLAGAYDPDNRRDMVFDTSSSWHPGHARVLEHVRILGQARACSKALRHGTRSPLLVEANVYAFARDAGDGARAITVLNRAPVHTTIDIPIPAYWDNTPFNSLFGTPATRDANTLKITLGAWESEVLFQEKACVPSP